MDDAQVGSVIRAVRIRRGLTQARVSVIAGVSQATVSFVEQGSLEAVSLKAIRAVSAALGISLPFAPRWRGGELPKLLDQRHAAIVREVLMRLGECGWASAVGPCDRSTRSRSMAREDPSTSWRGCLRAGHCSLSRSSRSSSTFRTRSRATTAKPDWRSQSVVALVGTRSGLESCWSSRPKPRRDTRLRTTDRSSRRRIRPARSKCAAGFGGRTETCAASGSCPILAWVIARADRVAPGESRAGDGVGRAKTAPVAGPRRLRSLGLETDAGRAPAAPTADRAGYCCGQC